MIDRARIGVPPADDYVSSEDFQIHGPNWLFFEVRSDFFGPTRMAAMWQAALVAGAFRDLASRADLPGVMGFSTTFHYPTGVSQTHETVLAGSTSHDVDSSTSIVITARIKSALEAARSRTGPLAAVLTFVRPVEHGVSLVVTAQDPKRAIVFFESGEPFGNLEGRYVEVRNSDGRPLMAFYASARTNTGGTWGPDERLLGKP